MDYQLFKKILKVILKQGKQNETEMEDNKKY